MSSSRAVRLRFLLLISVGAAAYANSYSGAFLFDDFTYIHENPSIFRFWHISDVLTATSRPLVNLTLAINYAFGQLDVWGYHAVNIVIHLLAGLTLYGLIRRSLLTQRVRHRYGPQASWLACSAATIWIVHPLHTQSVTYIIQRAETLMGLFYLLTLYSLLRATASDQPCLWHAITVLCCALGMTSKPVMVTAPIAVLLFDRAFLSASFQSALQQRSRMYWGLAATWILLGICLTMGSHDWSRSVGVSFGDASPLRYASTQFGVLLHYFRLAFWPHPLCFHYDWPLVGRVASAALPAAGVFTLLGAALWSWRTSPPIGFLASSIYLVLLPTSSALPIITEVAAEHRMYLPLAALVALGVLASWEGVGRVVATPRTRNIVATTLVILLTLVLGMTTATRNTIYTSPLTMWEDVVVRRPENPLAHNNRGVALKDADRWTEAEQAFREALRLQPNYADAHINLGVVMAHGGDLATAEAHFRQALTLQPHSATAHYHLGVALSLRDERQAAESHYRQTIALDPNFADAHINLGTLFFEHGGFDDAVTHYQNAVRAQPYAARTHYNLAHALAAVGHDNAAEMHYREAVRINPAHTDARLNLGVLCMALGRHTEAIQQFTELLRLDPHNTHAHHNLQHILHLDR